MKKTIILVMLTLLITPLAFAFTFQDLLNLFFGAEVINPNDCTTQACKDCVNKQPYVCSESSGIWYVKGYAYANGNCNLQNTYRERCSGSCSNGVCSGTTPPTPPTPSPTKPVNNCQFYYGKQPPINSYFCYNDGSKDLAIMQCTGDVWLEYIEACSSCVDYDFHTTSSGLCKVITPEPTFENCYKCDLTAYKRTGNPLLIETVATGSACSSGFSKTKPSDDVCIASFGTVMCYECDKANAGVVVGTSQIGDTCPAGTTKTRPSSVDCGGTGLGEPPVNGQCPNGLTLFEGMCINKTGKTNFGTTRKVGITKEQIKIATTNDLLAVSCLYNSDCVSLDGNYSVACQSLASLRNEGVITESSTADFFKIDTSTGVAIGVVTCAAAALGTATILLAPVSWIGLGSCVAVVTAGVVFDSQDELVKALKAKDETKVGICTLTEKPKGFSICSYVESIPTWLNQEKDCEKGTIYAIVGVILLFIIIAVLPRGK